jgi:flagellar hook-associated protein 1 FlgK
MGSSFAGLEIGKTGLLISQNELNITAHNIANVDTTGFTRQRLYTSAIPPASSNVQFASGSSSAGRGVAAVTVEQIRSPFLDYQYRNENSTSTKWQTKEQYFEYIEALFNNELEDMEISSGISSQLSNFYSSLYDLVEAPADSEIRANVQQNALKLTETMNYYYDRLTEQQSTLNESVRVAVSEVNDYAQQIAELNEKIFGYELSGERANDLRDQRGLLLDELSGIIEFEYSEDSGGNINIELDGKYLVRQTTVHELAVSATLDNPVKSGAENRLYEVYWADEDGNPTSGKVDIQNGALCAYMEIRDGNDESNIGLPYIIGQLNTLCQKITSDVNAIHRTGYNIPNDTNGNTSQTDIDFFEDTSAARDGSEVTAQNFKLSSAVLEDVYNIAASDSLVALAGEENEQRGNGEIALALAELVNQTDASGNPDNFDSVYKSIVTGIGIEMNHISVTASAQTVMQEHLDEQRQSVSGVSLDEEMTNMIRFQHAYTAASRVINAMDEQMDVLINKTGLVGRA